MAKAIVICFRNSHGGDLASSARATAEQIAPDNVIFKPHYSSFIEEILSPIYIPTPTIHTEGFNICLEQIINQLNIEDKVGLPGFVGNIYSYYKNGQACTVSSRVEGFSNV